MAWAEDDRLPVPDASCPNRPGTEKIDHVGCLRRSEMGDAVDQPTLTVLLVLVKDLQ